MMEDILTLYPWVQTPLSIRQKTPRQANRLLLAIDRSGGQVGLDKAIKTVMVGLGRDAIFLLHLLLSSAHKTYSMEE